MRPLAVTLALMLVGCGIQGESLLVGGASSLVDVLETIHSQAEADLDFEVELSITGSQLLVAAVEAGSPLDLIVAADLESLDSLELATPPQLFATNQLAIIVTEGNPLELTELKDLATIERLVLAAEEVPVGRYTAKLLEERQIQLEPVARELSARSVVTRVATGEADAGVAYLSAAAVEGIDAIPISGSETRYWLAAITEGENVQRFIDFLTSDRVTAILQDSGLSR